MGIKKKNALPPGPKSLIPLRNFFGFRGNSLKFLKTISKKYGDLVYFRMGPFPILFVNHPDYIKEVLSTQNSNFIKGRPLEMAKEILGNGLLTSEGEFHKQQSRIIQPAFHLKMMEIYAPAMTEYADRLMQQWGDGKEVDMMEEMIKMSTGIAGKTMFNVDIAQEVPGINKSLEDIMKIFGRVTIPFAELLLKIPLPGTIRFFKAKKKLDSIIYNIISDRKKNKLDNGDLLSLLLQAQKDLYNDEEVTDQQIRDEAMTLFLTAFDTTSLALTWTWHLLSKNPNVEKKLHDEIDRILNGRKPTIDDFPNLKYTRMVFEESMRLFPPIYIISRQAIDDFEIGSYYVPGGTIVLISPYLIHRDSRFHLDPDNFIPKSWDKCPKHQPSRYEYLPFSVGTRACIGQHYAWMEGVLVLASIAQFWKIEMVPNHPVEIDQLLNLRPKYGMKMVVHKR